MFLHFPPYFCLCSFLLRFDFIFKHPFVTFVHLWPGNNHFDKIKVQQTEAPFRLNTFSAHEKFLSEILETLADLLIFLVSLNNIDDLVYRF